MNGSGTTQQRDKGPQQQQAEQSAGACTSHSAPPDHEADQTRSQAVLDNKVIGLIDDVQLWWSMRKDLWAELKGLFVAERSLAAHSLVKLVIGGILAIMLILLCVVLTEILLALMLMSLGFPPSGSITVVLGLNILLLFVLIKGLKKLPAKLSFKETRAAFSNDPKPEDA